MVDNKTNCLTGQIPYTQFQLDFMMYKIRALIVWYTEKGT